MRTGLGVFPDSYIHFLASFAIMVSKSDNCWFLAENQQAEQLFTITTQGRLHCPQHRKKAFSTAWQVLT